MVARIAPHKGIRDFIVLARRLGDRAEFTLVGPGNDAPADLVAEVDQAHAEGIIDYRGAVHPPELAAVPAR